MSGESGKKKGAAAFWKWVGGVSALLSLLFALQQVASMLSDVGERKRRIAELERIAQQQQASAA